MPEKTSNFPFPEIEGENDHRDLLSQAIPILIDIPEFHRALTAHAMVELFSRLGLPDKVFLTFAAILAYTRGLTDQIAIPQRTIAATIYDLRKASKAEKDSASKRVGRYIQCITDKQRVVVIQIEVSKKRGARKNEISLYTVHAWEIIDNVLEYFEMEKIDDVHNQFVNMKQAMDRALDEFIKGSSRLVGRLGQKRKPLTSEQRMRALIKQIDKIIEKEFLNTGRDEARRLQNMVVMRDEERECNLRAWEGRENYLEGKDKAW